MGLSRLMLGPFLRMRILPIVVLVLLAGQVLAAGVVGPFPVGDERLTLVSHLSEAYDASSDAWTRAASVAPLVPWAHGLVAYEAASATLEELDAVGLGMALGLAAEDAGALRAVVEGLHGPTGTALLRVFSLFLRYESGMAEIMARGPGALPSGDFYQARTSLVAAAADLAAAVRAQPEGPFVDLSPVLMLDFQGGSSVYAADVMLLIDVGGDDTYANNAGGNARDCAGVSLSGFTAALLLDLSGDDTYGTGRSCGVNGGGYYGAGMLIDGGGNDVYVGVDRGVNGGGAWGAGLLVDVAGDDQYVAGGGATNGGGSAGEGALLDLEGHDIYVATEGGTNGGGQIGFGFLFDGQGNDIYTATGGGTNGGARADLLAARGVLVDLGGNDVYTATSAGTNGGSWAGLGFLYDRQGNDRYEATRLGVNGESDPVLGCFIICYVNHSGGLLLDTGGVDSYFDHVGGTGIDLTVAPKGYVGAQVDTEVPVR